MFANALTSSQARATLVCEFENLPRRALQNVGEASPKRQTRQDMISTLHTYPFDLNCWLASGSIQGTRKEQPVA